VIFGRTTPVFGHYSLISGGIRFDRVISGIQLVGILSFSGGLSGVLAVYWVVFGHAGLPDRFL